MFSSVPIDPFVATWIISFATILGLLIGSFLNVVIWRVPRGESIVSPPSACPKCGSGIKWFDNVPVISWLVLKAKCRNCKNPISWRYPLVELLTGVVFLLLSLKVVSEASSYGELLALLPLLYLGAIGVALAMIDLDTHKLPNKIVLPSYPIVLALVLATVAGAGWDWGVALRVLLGGVVLYAFYFVLCVVGGMGFGDVKLAGLLGMSLGFYGWEYVIIGGFLPFVLGGLFSAILLLAKRAGRKSGIPFGPWMIVGWFVTLFVAEPIASWYLALMF